MERPLLQEPEGASTSAASQNAGTRAPPRKPKRNPFLKLDLLGLRKRFMTRLHRDRPITVESLDYLPVENSFYFERQRETHHERHLYGYSGKTLAKFLITVLAGCCIGALATAIASANLTTIDARNALLQGIYDAHGAMRGQGFYIAFCLSLVLVASSLVVFIAPQAGGAGVSLVMAYLNGAHVPNLLRPVTLVVKAIGVVCGVSSNLAIGPEGPMVHMGAAVASTLASNNAYLLPGRIARYIRDRLRTISRPAFADDARFVPAPATPAPAHRDDVSEIGFLRSEPGFSDADMREFISAGVAAGIAAAFGAPVGGVLFSMEEASTFWSRRVAWRCFVCAVSAAFVISQLNTRVDIGLLSFDSVTYPGHKDWLYQLPFIVLTAVICGSIGALFNLIRKSLWAVRASRTRPVLRLMEAAGVCVVTCLVFFSVATMFGTCTETQAQEVGERPRSFGVRLQCPMHTQNDIATLLMSSPEETIRQIFSLSSTVGTGPRMPARAHWLDTFFLRDRAGVLAAQNTKPCTPSSCLFTPQSMGVVAACYLLCMSLACGVAVPGGLFMPSIMVGATSGALLGMLLQRVLENDWTIEPGLFALVGATATLAGVFRSSISLVVIVVEGTHGVDFLFTLIISALVANWAAAMIHRHGVYESELERDGTVFFLRHEVPRALKRLQVKDIMAAPPLCLRPIESLENVLTALRQTPHNGFPVVRAEGGAGAPAAAADLEAGAGPTRGEMAEGREGSGRASTSSDSTAAVLDGFILRSQLLVLLQRRAFCDRTGRPKKLSRSRLRGLQSPTSGSEPASPRNGSRSATPEPTFTSLPLGLREDLRELDRVHRGFYSQGPGKAFLHRRHLLSTAEAVDTILLDYLIESEPGVPAERMYSPPALSPRPSIRRLAADSPSASPLDLGRSATKGGNSYLLSPITEESVPEEIIDAEIELLRDLHVDLRPFMDQAPLTIHPDASAYRAYHIFLSLGLRHLCVVRQNPPPPPAARGTLGLGLGDATVFGSHGGNGTGVHVAGLQERGGLVGLITRKDLKAASDRMERETQGGGQLGSGDARD